MRMQVDQGSIAPGQFCKYAVHQAMALPDNRGLDVQEVEGIIAEGRVVDVAKKDRADRKRLEEVLKRLCKTLQLGSLTHVWPAKQVIATNRNKGDGLAFHGEPTCLIRQVADCSPILCTVDQAGGAKRGEIVPVKLREEVVIVADEQLSWVHSKDVIVSTVEHRVTKGIDCEHGSLLSAAFLIGAIIPTG